VAGADISELTGLDEASGKQFVRRGQTVFDLVENLGKPVIACVNGFALGGGCELAMASSIRLASDHAKFGLPEVKLGLLPGYGGTQRLPRLIGAAHALRMLLTGAQIDGGEALRLGLVTYIAPGPGRAALERVVGEVVRAISSRGPVAARLAKEAVRKGCDLTLDQGIRLEEDLYALLQTTADRAEGVRAFLDKRKPLFRGA